MGSSWVSGYRLGSGVSWNGLGAGQYITSMNVDRNTSVCVHDPGRNTREGEAQIWN